MIKLKYILFTVILLISCLSYTQGSDKRTNFYIVDTITINHPIIFYLPNQSGQFVIDSTTIKKGVKFNLKNAIVNDKVFIFGNDLYMFIDTNSKFNKYRYPDYGNCEFKSDYYKDIKGIVYQKYRNEPKEFVLALVNASYYNSKINAYGQKQSAFKNYDKSLYYKIVFPLCK